MARQYTHVQEVEKEMLEMKAAGKTNREIAEHFGVKDKYEVKEWFKRYNRRIRKRPPGSCISTATKVFNTPHTHISA